MRLGYTNAMKKILLYTAEACHLCEMAVEQIEQSEVFEQCLLTEIDIASDVDLLRQFATQVPVMSVVGSQDYLYWPFDHQDVTNWLARF